LTTKRKSVKLFIIALNTQSHDDCLDGGAVIVVERNVALASLTPYFQRGL